MSDRYGRLEEVVLDPLFPDVDLALRRGRHVTADDLAHYTFLSDARGHLEELYRRYGCELMHKSDGFFYLLPTGEKLGKRHLRPVEMLVGQALALLYLDPRTVEAGGTIVRDDVLGQLASVLGSDDLVRALYPGKKRVDERVAQEGVRAKVNDAIRKLGTLGFVSTTDEGRIKLGPALLRFAEPARLGEPPDVLLARLAQEGELVLTEGLDDDADLDDDAAEAPSSEPPADAPEETSSTPAAGPGEAVAEGRDAAPRAEEPPLPIPTPETAADTSLDDEPPFVMSSAEEPYAPPDDDAPYDGEAAGPPLDDEPYELEGPFGAEGDPLPLRDLAADDELPFEIDAPVSPDPGAEGEPVPPSEE